MQTARAIAKSPYLRLIAATVFLTAIVTQWTGLQLSLVTSRHFNSEATALTRFNGTFTLALGIVSFLVQLFATSQALRKFGLAVTILALPLSLGPGDGPHRPGSCVLVGARDQCIRSGIAVLG